MAIIGLNISKPKNEKKASKKRIIVIYRLKDKNVRNNPSRVEKGKFLPIAFFNLALLTTYESVNF